MATALDLIRDALLDVGVIGQDDEIDGTVAADAFRRLNQMLSSFGGSEGFITFQYPSFDADLLLEDGYEEMIWTNLAVRIAPSYGKEASATTQRIASATRRSLKRSTTIPPKARMDDLVYQGRLNNYGSFNVFANDYQGTDWLNQSTEPGPGASDGPVTNIAFDGNGYVIAFDQNGAHYIITYGSIAGRTVPLTKVGNNQTVTYSYNASGLLTGEIIS